MVILVNLVGRFGVRGLDCRTLAKTLFPATLAVQAYKRKGFGQRSNYKVVSFRQNPSPVN